MMFDFFYEVDVYDYFRKLLRDHQISAARSSLSAFRARLPQGTVRTNIDESE